MNILYLLQLQVVITKSLQQTFVATLTPFTLDDAKRKVSHRRQGHPLLGRLKFDLIPS